MGENKKVTKMVLVLKVDLQCEKCYRKVKKVLCKFPQIRDQTYDEKKNQVIIKVFCCSPEKIRDKLCCKGRCIIKSIDIMTNEPEPEPEPKPEPKPKPEPEPNPKPKPKPEPKPKPKPEPCPCPCPRPPCQCPRPPCPCPRPPCPCPRLQCTCPPVTPPLVNTCCTECYRGHPGGPCQTGCGYGVPDPYRQYDGYCGRPVYGSYCSEENPQACAIM